MRTPIRIVTVGAILVALAVAATTAVADPLPGEQLKFIQRPMVQLSLCNAAACKNYCGHDEISTARLTSTGDLVYQGYFMADDFADTSEQPVAHVQWWGSYLDAAGTVPNPVRRFLIAFETDVPADPSNPDSFSHPGDPILAQVVTPGRLSPSSGTFTEKLIHPGCDPCREPLYEYNAELAIPFKQQPDVVYWLKIVALVDPDQENVIWGWHNRDYTIQDPLASPNVKPGERDQGPLPGVMLPDGTPVPVWHFQDDAVQGQMLAGFQPGQPIWLEQTGYLPTYYNECDMPPQPVAYSKDLAFALYTPVPEPSTILLLAIGLGCLLVRRRN